MFLKLFFVCLFCIEKWGFLKKLFSEKFCTTIVLYWNIRFKKSIFLLSGNTSFSHTSRNLILTKLSYSDWYLDHYSRTNNGGVRGHDGVTGVKKVIFTKQASGPTEYLALTHDLRICICLTPSTKVITLKLILGHVGSQGSKGNFHHKRHQVLENA